MSSLFGIDIVVLFVFELVVFLAVLIVSVFRVLSKADRKIPVIGLAVSLLFFAKLVVVFVGAFLVNRGEEFHTVASYLFDVAIGILLLSFLVKK